MAHGSGGNNMIESRQLSQMIPNPGYQQTPINMANGSGGNMAHGSGGNNMIESRQLSQMIPTPGYQQTPINMAYGSGGNNMIESRQLSQVIPTPGLNNLQQISMISESPHGVGFSRIDSTMVSQQQHQQQQHQQKQFVGSQNSRILHALGGQMVGGPRPNMQQKPSPYGFSNRVMNGGMGMIGNNVHMMNGPAASESYMNTSSSSGGSSNSLQQQFDQQHNLPNYEGSNSTSGDSSSGKRSLKRRRLLDEVERLKKELEEAKAAGAELAATLESQLQAK